MQLQMPIECLPILKFFINFGSWIYQKSAICESLLTSMNLLCFSTEVCKFIIEQDACFGGENSGSKSEKQEQLVSFDTF